MIVNPVNTDDVKRPAVNDVRDVRLTIDEIESLLAACREARNQWTSKTQSRVLSIARASVLTSRISAFTIYDTSAHQHLSQRMKKASERAITCAACGKGKVTLVIQASPYEFGIQILIRDIDSVVSDLAHSWS